MKKFQISQYRRHRIYAHDHHECVFCAGTINLSIDHLIPQAAGGTNAAMNLVTACRPCNLEKGPRVATPDSLRYGRFREHPPSAELCRVLTNATIGGGVDWNHLQTVLTPTAKRVHRIIYHSPFAIISVEELLHEGMLAIVDQQLHLLEDKKMRLAARRAMWDFAIRQHRHVALPQNDQSRTRATKALDAVIQVDSYDGPVDYENQLIFGIDLKAKIQKLTNRPKQLWLYTLMGYTIQDIADMTGLKKGSISAALAKNRIVPRTQRNLGPGEIRYGQNRGPRMAIT